VKVVKILNLIIVCLFTLNCSGIEKSKVVDIYSDGSPKQIEVYAGNPPKMELSKYIFISSFGDTSIIINVQDGDTIMPEIKKEIVKSKFPNGNNMTVEHWVILGHDENLTEIHYFDETGDILQIDDKLNGTLRKYAELHPDIKRWMKPEINPFKDYLHGKWDVISKYTGKKYLAEFKGSAYSYSEIDYSGTKKWEEIYSINYIWNFGLEFRMLNKGFPKDRIKPGRRDNYLLAIDTKDKFDMENDENYFEFNRRK
jgi:hypothetical protein